MHKYDLIIFDWDGTLMDSMGQIIDNFEFAIADLGWDSIPYERIKHAIGLNFPNTFSMMFPDIQENRELMENELQQAYIKYFNKDDFSREVLFKSAEPALLKFRQAGIKLAVATGKGRTFLDAVFYTCGYSKFFDAVRTSDRTRSKPDPLMLKEILEELGIKKNRALMVGDTSYDLEMAKRIGMDSVGITTGGHSRDILAQYNPIKIIDDLAELYDIVFVSN